MSKLYITEYAETPTYIGQSVAAGLEPGVTQVVDYSGGATASAAFAASTKFIRLHTDAICSVLFAAAPVATTASPRMAAGSTEFFGVVPGQKVSGIINV